VLVGVVGFDQRPLPSEGSAAGGPLPDPARQPRQEDRSWGWASQSWSAASIALTIRGVGLLLQEGGVPVRLRAFYLDDTALAGIVRHAEAVRKGAPRGEAPTLRLVDGSA
jgi:hypothetical protein